MVESLAKSFSETKKSDLEKMNELLFDLYYANNIEGAKNIINVATKIKFNGNFNLWSFLQPSYCLKYFLSSDEIEKKEITRMLYEDVKSSLDTLDEHLEFLLEVQNGCLLNSAHNKLLKNMNNIQDEYIWRSNLVRKYLHILALGAGGSISHENCFLEINKNTEKLRELYKITNKIK